MLFCFLRNKTDSSQDESFSMFSFLDLINQATPCQREVKEKEERPLLGPMFLFLYIYVWFLLKFYSLFFNVINFRLDVFGIYIFWVLSFLPIFFVLQFFDFSICIINFVCYHFGYHFMLTFLSFSVIIWMLSSPPLFIFVETWNTPCIKVIF